MTGFLITVQLHRIAPVNFICPRLRNIPPVMSAFIDNVVIFLCNTSLNIKMIISKQSDEPHRV